jgi:hypothetical protein
MNARDESSMNPAHSNHEPGATHSANRISVRLIPVSSIAFQIKQSNSTSAAMKMNTSNPNQDETPPPLFQMAAFFEDFFPASGARKPAPALRPAPFADLRRHFQNLKAKVKSAPGPNNAAAPRRDEPIHANRAIRPATSGKRGANGADELHAHSVRELKKVEFLLEAPSAASVKLVADFTGWDEHPVELMHSPDGFWFIVVPLTPGSYSYRFIVDGEWRDDPRATRRVPNPFGTENAVVQVG